MLLLLYIPILYNCSTSVEVGSPTVAQQQPLQSQTGQPSTATVTTGGGKLESGSRASLKSGPSIDGSGEKVGNDDPLKQSHASQQPGPSGSGADGGSSSTTVGGCEEPTAGIFIQTAAYLLDVHALKVWWLNI